MTKKTAAFLLQISFLFFASFFLLGTWRPASSELQAAEESSNSLEILKAAENLENIDIDVETVKPLVKKAIVVVLSIGAALWFLFWLWHKICYGVGFLVNGGKRHFGYGHVGGGVVDYGDATAALGSETIKGLITTLIVIGIAVFCITAYYVGSTADNNASIEQQDD